ncbi:MAG: TPM domain-containing protein [Candidatus Omnitrophica bacterium]|nr:TPM domain-containing protein [Candidatus Omnitrophota bacterium]
MKKNRYCFIKILFFFGCSLFLTACSKDAIYPQRPIDHSYFYNETSLQQINGAVIVELKYAYKITGVEFALVMLKKNPSAMPVEEYAAGLFDAWRIGERNNGRGVLILFIEDVGTVKIEVGYAVEHIFTDTFCSNFQPTVKAYYNKRHFGDAFCGFIRWMYRRYMSKESADADELMQLRLFAKDREMPEGFLSGGGGIVDSEYITDKKFKLSLIRDISKEEQEKYKSDKNIEIVIKRYFQSLEQGVNYPYLDILTKGSQMMRFEYPESMHFMRFIGREYAKALPYRIIENKQLALVRFKDDKALPLFMRKDSSGYWKLDIVKSWVFSYQDEQTRKIKPFVCEHAWMFGFPEYNCEDSLFNVPDLSPLDIDKIIKKLEENIVLDPNNASNYFRLADIFYFEYYWINSAIDMTERGLLKDPNNLKYRWLAIVMHTRVDDFSQISKHYEAILNVIPDDFIALYRYSLFLWNNLEYKKAIRLVKKAKIISKRAEERDFVRGLLEKYKNEFNGDISTGRNFFWKTCMYIYLFLFP